MPDKILIVDDEPDMLQILRWALSPVGAVISASNGRDALRLLAGERPRLLLLDVAMPGMGGIELCAAARALDPNVIVVMLTGICDIEVAKEALDRGACAYITKPFDDEFLRGEVERLLDRGKKGKAAADSGRPWRVAE
jgi:DNA-binding response OmpR family regulator